MYSNMQIVLVLQNVLHSEQVNGAMTYIIEI